MADVANTLNGWSTTESSNSPLGTTTIGTGLDENLRMIQAVVRQTQDTGTIASATTTDLSTVNAKYITVSGVTTITGLGTLTAGMTKWLIFSGALTLTHNGTSLILPGAANITTVAGDTALMESLGSGNWKCLAYEPTTWTGTGGQVHATSPTLVTPVATTSLTTGSTTFSLINTTATTVNFAGAASTALNIGHASGTNTILGATTFSQNLTASGTLGVTGAITGGTGNFGDGITYIHNTTGNHTLRVGTGSTSSTTAGFEFYYTAASNTAMQQIYDRVGAAYKNLVINALSFDLQLSTTTGLSIASTGAVTIPGTLGVTNNIDLTEMTAPTGTANVARIFAVDNGSGKTVLKVIFGSGAAQVIATEP